MNNKRIAIIGLGGVGGYFGFKINQTNRDTNRHHISFVARDKTYEVIRENGLTLLSPEYSNNVTKPDDVVESINKIKSPDLIFICVKEYDLENVCNQLSEVISKETIIVPMMNGADIYERIRSILPHNVILPSCVYVASHIKEKGIVEHNGKPGRLFLGRDPEHFSKDIDWIVDLVVESEINLDFKDSSLVDIWTKFIFIASFGLVSAKYNSSIGAVCKEELQKKEAIKIMEEIKLIAFKKSIDLGDDIIIKTFQKATTFPPKTPTSLQLDINSNKKNNELELFAGSIIRYGRELGVETPFTEKIYGKIKRKIYEY
jgi:2-dehydropantoate 2-reductase